MTGAVAVGWVDDIWPGSEYTGGPGYLLYATLTGPSNPPAIPLPTATATMHLR